MTDEHTFTVRDRRTFKEDGERREGGSTEPQPAQEANAADTRVEETELEAAPEPDVAADETDVADEPVTLVGFIVNLGAQAGMLLGGLPNEDGSPGEPDPRGARHVIGILEMLKDRTKGNLTQDEERMLDRVLYELRMAYLRITTQAST
jgi:hypothetical protein